MKNFYFPLALYCVALAGCAAKPAPTPTEPQTISSDKPAPTPMAATTPTDAPKATKPDAKKYRVRGLVNAIEKSEADGRMTLLVNHEAIPDFMSAMQMRLPFAGNAEAQKVKAGDKIVFDLQRGTLDVSNVEVLPASTELKLKP